MGQLGGEAPGDGEPHAGEAIGNDHRIGADGREVAGEPHLVGAHVADQDVLFPQRLSDLPDDPLRLERTLSSAA
jgi:hypothetical protein